MDPDPSPCELSTLPFLSDFMAISGKGRFIGVLDPLLEWGLSGDGCEMADGVGGWANESRWGGMYGELGWELDISSDTSSVDVLSNGMGRLG